MRFFSDICRNFNASLHQIGTSKHKLMTQQEQLTTETRDGALYIRSKWLKRSHIILFIVTGAYFIGLAVYLVPILMRNDIGALLLWCFPALLGVLMLYYSAACLLNTTTLHATRERIEIKTRPLSLFDKDKSVNMQHVGRLYVREHLVRRKNSHSVYYCLMCVDGNNAQQEISRANEAEETQALLALLGEYYHVPISEA